MMEYEENEIDGLHKKQGTSSQSVSEGAQRQTSASDAHQVRLERQENAFQ